MEEKKMTIEEYLQILPNYTFPDRLIRRAMGKFSIPPGSPAFEIDERLRDLAEAEMWESAAGLVNGGAYKKKIGNRSITTASLQTSQQDRLAWMSNANSLRAKWGEQTVGDVRIIEDNTFLW